MKKQIPTWSAVVATVVVLSLVVGFFLTSNPGSLDRDALIRAREKPGSSPPATTASTYGMPRGTPISHQPPPSSGAMARQKPGG